MTAIEILDWIHGFGVQLRVRDGLILASPAGVLPAEARDAVVRNKRELLGLLIETAPTARGLALDRFPPGSPYEGFFVPSGVRDPERARAAAEEAQRWREERADWLRRVLGAEGR